MHWYFSGVVSNFLPNEGVEPTVQMLSMLSLEAAKM